MSVFLSAPSGLVFLGLSLVLISHDQFQASWTRHAKRHHPHHPGWCKIFRVWVKFVTEHAVLCRKLNFLSHFFFFGGGGVKVVKLIGGGYVINGSYPV